MRSFPTADAVTTVNATTALPRRSTYVSFKPTIRTFIRSPPANEIHWKSLARTKTLPSRYSVLEYITNRLAIHQELGGTKEAIPNTTIDCHFLFEPYHDRSTLSLTTMTTIGVLTAHPR